MKKIKEISSKLKEKSKYIYLSILSAIMVAASNQYFAYAVDNKYATNTSNWLMSGVQSLATVGAVVIVAKCLINRKFVQMLLAVLIAALILAIVYNPSFLRSIGDYIFNVILG